MPRIIVDSPKKSIYFIYDKTSQSYVRSIDYGYNHATKTWNVGKIHTVSNYFWAKGYKRFPAIEKTIRDLIQRDPRYYGRFNVVRVDVEAMVTVNEPFENMLTNTKKKNTLSKIDPRDLVQLRQQGKL